MSEEFAVKKGRNPSGVSMGQNLCFEWLAGFMAD
jgi:hypothetical protein